MKGIYKSLMGPVPSSRIQAHGTGPGVVKAFTLVEVLVSITIFSIMMISIISIYMISTDITLKSDINRIMQENLKNVSNKIAEDIRKEWIVWVSSDSTDECNFSLWANNYKYGDKLCTKSWNKYYLAKINPINWEYIRVTSAECSKLDDMCVIAQWLTEPLTNSYVSVKSLEFYLSRDFIPKVTMNIILQPSVKKWVKPDLIKESRLIFQTTISERPF